MLAVNSRELLGAQCFNASTTVRIMGCPSRSNISAVAHHFWRHELQTSFEQQAGAHADQLFSASFVCRAPTTLSNRR